MYFAGWVLTLLFIPWLADRFGRKWIFSVAIGAQVLVYGGIMVSSSLTLTLILMFCFGMINTARTNVGWVFLMELLPKQK